MHWWVGVEWADDDLDLGVDALLLVGVLADDGEGSDTLTVETLGSVSRARNPKVRGIHTMFLAKDWARATL